MVEFLRVKISLYPFGYARALAGLFCDRCCTSGAPADVLKVTFT